MVRQRPMLKAVATIAAASVALAMVVTSPVGAAFTPTKGKIKKIAKKQAKRQAKKQIKRLAPGIAAETDGRVGFAYNPAVVTPPAPDEFVTLASVGVTAPVPGFLVLHGKSHMEMVTTSDVYGCDLTLDGTPIGSSLVIDFVVAQASQDPDSGGDAEDDISTGNILNICSPHTVVPVTAGSHTIALRAATIAAPEEFNESLVSAQFVPFDGAGAPPTTFALTKPGKASSDSSSRRLGRFAREAGFEVPSSF